MSHMTYYTGPAVLIDEHGNELIAVEIAIEVTSHGQRADWSARGSIDDPRFDRDGVRRVRLPDGRESGASVLDVVLENGQFFVDLVANGELTFT